MLPISEKTIRTSFVNASRKETSDLTPPRPRDDRVGPARLPRLARPEDRPSCVRRRPDPRRRPRRHPVPAGRGLAAVAGPVLWCARREAAERRVFWSAKRPGKAGGTGTPVGTALVCQDFQCSRNVRRTPPLANEGFDVEAARLRSGSRTCSSARRRSPRRSDRTAGRRTGAPRSAATRSVARGAPTEPAREDGATGTARAFRPPCGRVSDRWSTCRGSDRQSGPAAPTARELVVGERQVRRADVLLEPRDRASCRGSARRRRPARAARRGRPGRGVPPASVAIALTSSTMRMFLGEGLLLEAGFARRSRRSRGVRRLRDRTGQEPAAERRVRHEPDPELTERVEDVALGSRVHSEYSLWSAVIGCTAWALRIVAADASTGRCAGSCPPARSRRAGRSRPRSARPGRRGAGSTGDVVGPESAQGSLERLADGLRRAGDAALLGRRLLAGLVP